MKVLIVTIAVLAVFFLIVDLIDINRFVVREYKIESPKINNEVKIVFLSDLHNRQYGRDNIRLVDAVDSISPDFICCGGDMLTAHPNESTEPAVSLMKKISGYPVFYGIGNHEYRMKIYTDDYADTYDNYIEKLKTMGITVLENESVESDTEISKGNSILIQGLMIGREYYKRFGRISMNADYVRSLTANIDDSQKIKSNDTTAQTGVADLQKQNASFRILLAHNPEYFQAYAESGADLVLSGHVHGGIMRLPLLGGVISPRLRPFPKFDGGIFRYEGSTMVLSRGLGCHTLPLRIFNPGELVYITLSPCKK